MVDVGVVIALTTGVLSFLSPCVLPLVPSYISYVAGMSFEEVRGSAANPRARRAVMLNAVAFVVGFSSVFIALGASASLLGQTIVGYQPLIRKVGGILVIFFGLYLIGVVRIPFLMREMRLRVQNRPAGCLGSALVGIAFGAGWVPCVGPVLGTILTLAGTSEKIGQGTALLAVYSAGLGIPFLAAALALEPFTRFFGRFKRFLPLVDIVAGAILIVVGTLLYTGYITILNSYLIGLTPRWLWKRL